MQGLRNAFVAAALVLSAALATAEKGFQDLTPDTFDSFIEEHPLVFLEFEAPWCGHCRKLREDLDTVVDWVNDNAVDIDLARVDVNEHPELAERYGLAFFPVFMMVTRGKAERFPTLNNGRAIRTNLAKWLSLPPPPPFRPINSMEDAVSWLFWRGTDGGIMETALVADLRGATEDQTRALEAAAIELVEEVRVGDLRDPAVADAFSFPEPPTLALYKDFDEGKVYFRGPWTTAGITEFVRQQRVPLAFYVTHWNLDHMRGLPRGVFAHVFVEEARVENGTLFKPLRQALMAEALALEEEYSLPRGVFSFVATDGEKYASWKERFDLPQDALPSVGVLNKVDSSGSGAVYEGDANDMAALARFAMETAKPSILSAAEALGIDVTKPPATNGEL